MNRLGFLIKNLPIWIVHEQGEMRKYKVNSFEDRYSYRQSGLIGQIVPSKYLVDARKPYPKV